MTERMLSGYQADIKKALYQSNLHCNIRPQYLEWEQISLHLISTENPQSCGRKLGAVKKNRKCILLQSRTFTNSTVISSLLPIVGALWQLCTDEIYKENYLVAQVTPYIYFYFIHSVQQTTCLLVTSHIINFNSAFTKKLTKRLLVISSILL